MKFQPVLLLILEAFILEKSVLKRSINMRWDSDISIYNGPTFEAAPISPKITNLVAVVI